MRITVGDSGEPDELAEKYQIDSNSIIIAVNRLLQKVK